MALKTRFSIDRGGTFTDIYAEIDHPDGRTESRVMKLLSEDPKHYASAPREGIRRILESVMGVPHPRDAPVPFAHIESIRMGTTVATNALLERKGARMALLVTAGFRDLLHIGNQSRPRIFDLRIARPENLYEAVVEVPERVVLLKGAGEDLPQHLADDAAPGDAAAEGDARYAPHRVVTGSTGDRLLVERAPDLAALEPALAGILAGGVTSVAVVLLHSYAFPDHELAVGALCRRLGFTQVSLSHEVMPMVKAVPRGYTAAADAYLTPHILRYVADFKSGFEQGLESVPGGKDCPTRLSFMQSDGGLTPVQFFSGHRAVLSGPAAGVVGYALTTWDPATAQPVVALDVGGTSSDVSRFAGTYEHVFEATVAGISIQAPQLDISTVAAGGGSRLFFRSGMFAVGPESAGAHPGPVCYRKGGHLAVTDANLALGRVVPRYFPSIFGPGEDQPLDEDGSRASFAALAEEVNAHYAAAAAAGGLPPPPPKSVDEIAAGFVAVANEAMCRPIRALTQMKGYDVSTHVLACFGGAGPQHACAIATALGMRRIFISRYSGILSAYGLSLADVVNEAQAPLAVTLVSPRATGAVADKRADGAVAPVSAPLPDAEDDDGTATPGASSAAAAAAGSEAAAALAAALADAHPSNLSPVTLADVAGRLAGLAAEVGDRLRGQGFPPSAIGVELYVNLRYAGTDTAIMTPCVPPGHAAEGADCGGGGGAGGAASSAAGSLFALPLDDVTTGAGAAALVAAAVGGAPTRFVRAYQREYGFVLRGREVLVDDVRVRGIARGAPMRRDAVPAATGPAVPVDTAHTVYFDGHGRVPTPIYALSSLTAGHAVPGPALILDSVATILVEPGFTARITPFGDVEIVADDGGSGGGGDAAPAPVAAATKAAPPAAKAAAPQLAYDASLDAAHPPVPCDPIRLSIFGHRFMSIAEQMGRTLQRTSISVNMRERLDYSCALFGPDGGLVANAPHIPVHLGAMQDAVRFQLAHWGADLADGDVLVSNHPQLAGGSHLPDITVITPVFEAAPHAPGAAKRIVFFVASRGHHADIGGIAPGSMPPHSKTLAEEGAAIVAFKLVAGGVFQEDGITRLLLAPGHSGIPGCAGSRNLRDCLSDLRAQVAANTRGIHLVRGLIAEYGLPTVHAYMRHIQAAAEGAVRAMLTAFSASRGLPEVGGIVTAVDYMDDGTPIALAITIDRRGGGSAVFDFTGTGPQVWGNTNAPRAVAYSAILYCLRCLVDQDVPLNQGCLAPIGIVIPPGSLLHPSPTAAVVGGNVLTSQRVVDVVLRAFGAAAASQGCMNNLTFGSDAPGAEYGYYETIAGGAGAGPGWQGRSGVHSHMTNTRITDPEILERRYPVVLRAFKLRPGSGGAGAYRGGDGVVRELQFRSPATVSILSERRAFAPYGLAGGGPGARGVNTLIRDDGAAIGLGGKNTVAVAPGDRLRIESPGGGGYGAPPAQQPSGPDAEYAAVVARARGDAAAAAAAVVTTTGPVVADDSSGAASSAFLFSGSVGRYKEAQETV